MRSSTSTRDLFSAKEIAAAARVDLGQVSAIIRSGRIIAFRGFVAPAEAVRCVRALAGAGAAPDRAPLSVLQIARSRKTVPLLASSLLHGALLAAIIAAGLMGLFAPHDTEELLNNPLPVQLVFLALPGPGGGGGGGGMKAPTPAPQIQRKAPVPIEKKVSRPAPIVRRIPPPPPIRPQRPPVIVEPPRIVAQAIETPQPPPPPPPQIAFAPVRSVAADPVDAIGVISSQAPAPSPGPGSGGGVGSSAGAGTGEGTGPGIGPGSGGGAGGGPFRPGSGITPPTLLSEVHPVYTPEARRRAIEGDVGLEVVVARDGRVSSVRVTRSLEAGLDQKAIEAVRQWRFSPARRQGVAVDVVVEVSVEFKLR